MVLSVLVNAVIVVLLIVVWFDWHNGVLNNLTGGLEQSTCQHFFNKEASGYVPTGTPVTIGDVKFVPTYLTSQESNSAC